MKTLKILILALIMTGQGINGTAQETSPADELSDVYVYPVDGRALTDLATEASDGRVAACQLPASVLASISTGGLIETCLNYPLNHFVDFANNHRKTFEEVVQGSNAYQELFKRPDAASLLLKRYSAINIGDIYKYGEMSDEWLDFYNDFKKISLLISRPELLSKMNADEQIQLTKELMSRLEMMTSQYKEVYGGAVIIYYAAAPLANLLVLNNYKPFTDGARQDEAMKRYMESLMMNNKGVLDTLMKHGRDYLIQSEKR